MNVAKDHALDARRRCAKTLCKKHRCKCKHGRTSWTLSEYCPRNAPNCLIKTQLRSGEVECQPPGAGTLLRPTHRLESRRIFCPRRHILDEFQILEPISEFPLSIEDGGRKDPREGFGVNGAAVALAPLDVSQLFGAHHWAGYWIRS